MRKQCKRKHYQLLNPILHALQGCAITPDSVLLELRTRELGAIEGFVKGTAGLQEWSDLTAMLNVCEFAGRNGVGKEVLDTCKQAQQALVEAAARFESTGRMGTTGSGLQAFRDLYEWHDLQRKSISRSQYEQMIAGTRNHIKSRSSMVEVIA